jgi:hypothetical protein
MLLPAGDVIRQAGSSRSTHRRPGGAIVISRRQFLAQGWRAPDGLLAGPVSLTAVADPSLAGRFQKGRVAMQPVGIVGDFNAANHTHQATNAGLAHAGVPFEWVPTTDVHPKRPEDRLHRYGGIFVAPSSPYESMEGALAAIRMARERGVPLVGT